MSHGTPVYPASMCATAQTAARTAAGRASSPANSRECAMQPEEYPAPTAEQRILAAVSAVCHGPYIGAKARAQLLHPVTDPLCHNGVMLQAEAVLVATVRAVFAELHPEDLARLSQAVAKALEKWPPRFQALDSGKTHFRRE